MAATVFISYASSDPQWPEHAVRSLGELLEQHGANVRLDLFHAERASPPGKMSPDQSREWMDQAIRDADRVICLVSARYAQAVKRNVAESWGYGVAYESQQLLAALYRAKGHNDKRVLTVRHDDAPEELVPEKLRDHCSHYQWPAEQKWVIEHATMARLTAPPASAGESALRGHTSSDVYALEAAQALDHARITTARLKAPDAAPFYQLLQADLQRRPGAPPWVGSVPADFVGGLSQSEPRWAREVMLAVRRVLKRGAPRPADPVRQAAVALYMLCAIRWVARPPAGQPGHAVLVPPLRPHALAVLSAAMFGGEVALVPDGAGRAQPMHHYQVSAAASADRQTSLLAALYAALLPDRMDATDVARRDSFPASERERLLGAVRVRLEDIRDVDQKSFTLVVNDGAAWDTADWASRLDASPFVLDPELSQDLFAMPPDELEAMVDELWRLIQAPATTPPAA